MYPKGEGYHVRIPMNYDSILEVMRLTVSEMNNLELLNEIKDIISKRIDELEGKHVWILYRENNSL